MPIKILMPALSPTMEMGNLTKWAVKVGDAVKSGDVIAEIETDKATMEVEAVDEGIVAKLVIAEGATDVPVNTLIAILAEEGEDAAAAIAAAEGGASAPPPAAAPAAASPAPVTAAPAAAPVVAAAAPAGNRVFASPLARRVAREAGLDLAAIKGSGPHGRIILRDVEAAKAAPAKPVAVAAAPATAAPAAKPLAAPHFYVTVDVELDALLAMRQQLNDSAPLVGDKPAYKLSVNDLVVKAYALALKAVPAANVSWTDAGMLVHKHADIGIAVSIPGGLITPIVRHAEEKTLSAISGEIKDLAKRAKDRKLKPEEYQGGTSSVSNLGMFGIKDFAAIINPPHATILAVGAGEKRVVVKGGAPAVATVMTVTLSTDHRAVDGALGAEFLAAFKTLIENPMGMLV